MTAGWKSGKLSCLNQLGELIKARLLQHCTDDRALLPLLLLSHQTPLSVECGMAKECSSKIVSHPLCSALAHRLIAASSSSHLPLCLSVLSVDLLSRKEKKWKEAKELTKNEKKAKNKKQQEEEEESDRNAKGERCVIVIVDPSLLPSFLPSCEPMQ
jgi:hypothetical protein